MDDDDDVEWRQNKRIGGKDSPSTATGVVEVGTSLRPPHDHTVFVVLKLHSHTTNTPEAQLQTVEQEIGIWSSLVSLCTGFLNNVESKQG